MAKVGIGESVLGDPTPALDIAWVPGGGPCKAKLSTPFRRGAEYTLQEARAIVADLYQFTRVNAVIFAPHGEWWRKA